MVDPSVNGFSQITPADLKIAGGVLLGFASFLAGLITWMTRTAFKMGQDASKVFTFQNRDDL